MDTSRQENHAALACDRCKGRKIKCDRFLPACTTCEKTTASCTYPLVSKKPGPKIGSSQRRRLRHSREPTTIQDARSLQREGTVNRILRGLVTRPSDLEARNNEQNISFTRQEVSQNDVSELEIEAGNLPSPAATSEHSISRGLSLSQLIHPSHEPTSEPYSAPRPPVGEDEGTQLQVIIDICNDLGISVNSYRPLLDAYFVNMTAFSLFHQPTFDKKLLAISSSIQRKSLLASMFSFSVRFIEIDLHQNRYNSPKAFRDLAEQSITEALDECVDETPPLCILQAMVLTTFQQLANGVRGRSWRSMGTLVRIGYELQLHLIDKNSSYDNDQENDIRSWSLDEERRRTWWAIWEFDVFASTIRLLPTAIDWSQNSTWLPIDDKLWFNNSFQSSCHLNPDAAFAWKDLEKSGNKGPKAWFIVINALMRTAHIISHHQLYFNPNLCVQNSQGMYNLVQPPPNDTHSMQSQLETLSNALYCFYVALPISLSFQGEFLSFSTSNMPGMPTTLQEDSAKHSIHIMTQLSRFMLYHRQVFNNSARDDSSGINTPTGVRSVDHGSWSRYLNAAQDIINIIRNSSHKHVQYVNPFLVNTIWLAATAQIVSRLFGPPLNNPRLAESNLDLLQMNIDAYISFWGVSRTLKQKLKAIELRLETFLRRHADQQLEANRSAVNSGGSPEQTPQLHKSNQSSTLNPVSHCEAEDGMDYHPGTSAGDEALRLDLWPLDVSGNISALDIPFHLYDFGLDEMLTYGT